MYLFKYKISSPLINTTSQLSHLQNKNSNLRPAAQQFYRPPTAFVVVVVLLNLSDYSSRFVNQELI